MRQHPPSNGGHPRLYRFLTHSPLAVAVTRDPRIKQWAVRVLRVKTRVAKALDRATGGTR